MLTFFDVPVFDVPVVDVSYFPLAILVLESICGRRNSFERQTRSKILSENKICFSAFEGSREN